MKRFVHCALLAAIALVVTAPLAHARWSEPQDISWWRARSNTVQGFPNRADTLYTPIAASKADTSAAFNLLDSDLPGIWALGKSAADSTQVGWLVILGDSTVTNTVNFKATTCAIQVNWGASSIGWTTAVTYTSAQTDGTKFWAIPLFASLGALTDYGIDAAQVGYLFAPSLRVIVTGGSSATVPMARIRLIKYRAPGAPAGGATSNF